LPPHRIVLSDRTVDLLRRVVHGPDGPIRLSAREADLLAALAARPGQTVSFDELHRVVWQHAPSVISRAAYYGQRRLLPKIERDPKLPRHLHLDHGVGLRLQLPPDPPSEPATSRAAAEPVANQLPAAVDRFVGRRPEIDAVVASLEAGDRLVVLTGPGGVGKSRLALEVARRLRATRAALDEARSVDGLCAVVGRALSVPLPDDDPVTRLGHALRARGQFLLVLDDLEQCVDAALAVVPRWLSLAPEVALLCTSRVEMRLPGARTVVIPPLPLDEALVLLLARAPVAVPEAHRGHARRLVEALGGLPLAIELAAARLRLMALPEVLARMPQALLASEDPRGSPCRGMAESLALSWSLLAPPARAALAELTVFEAAFDRAAAQAVLGAADDALQALIEASLLQVHATTGRLSMLSVVRQFAATHLSDAARAGAEQRHGAHFARSDPAGPRESDIDDLVGACRRAIGRGDGRIAAETLERAVEVLRNGGPMATGLALAEQVLATSLSEADRARASTAASTAARACGRSEEARAHAEAALALARRAGDPRAEGLALEQLGLVHLRRGEAALAERVLEEALAVSRASGHADLEGYVEGHLGMLQREQDAVRSEAHCRRGVALHRRSSDSLGEGIVLAHLAAAVHQQGQLGPARALYAEALALARETDNRLGEASLVGNLAILEHQAGELDRARAGYEAALALHRSLGDRATEGIVLANLGTLHEGAGRPDMARDLLLAAVAIHREVADRRSEGIALANLCDAFRQAGQIERARAHGEEALAIHRQLGNRWAEGVVLAQLAMLEADADRARRHLALGETLLREVGDVLELGKLLCVRVELEAREGRRDAALLALRKAEVAAARAGVADDAPLRIRIGEAAAALGAGADDEGPGHGTRGRERGDGMARG
jgi:tetratricopeptide (TPR) repeat protein